MQTPPPSPVELPRRQVRVPTGEPGGRTRVLARVPVELQAFRWLEGNQAWRRASPDRDGTSVLWGLWAWEEEEVWIWDA